MNTPTAEEVFDKPYPEPTGIPPAWDAELSVAAYLTDKECARLMVNYIFDPPITDEEIDKYSRRFGLSKNQAEAELRRGRNGNA